MGPELLPMHRGLACRFGRFGTLLAMLAVLTSNLRSVDFYLPHTGPASLRFAPVLPRPWDFKWPMPKVANGSTNETQNPTAGSTNSTVLASSSIQQTNSTTASPMASSAAWSVFSDASPFAGLDANPSSASNLLLLTPQMLADFFKATLDQTAVKPSTNGFGGVDPSFIPPMPKPVPSSEATYRVE
jgi:hypothetical protein